jgi:hypothetical protein
MLPSCARSFGRTLWRTPTSRTVYWYGLGAGLIPGLLWSVLTLASIYGPFRPSPVLDSFLTALGYAPLVLVAATGFWIGRRSGSVRDGAFAGLIAGGAFAAAYLVLVQVILLPQEIGELRAWHTNAAFALVVYAGYDLIVGLICGVIGAIVGGIGALVGRRWHRRGQPGWRESAGLVVARIDDADLLEGIAAEAPGSEPSTVAE